MQGLTQLILRGKKKDVERFRLEMGMTELPDSPTYIRDLRRSDEYFLKNYDKIPDDGIVKYCFEPGCSGNVSGAAQQAEEIGKAFPELELLLIIRYLDYEECGDAVYSEAGSAKSIQMTWAWTGYTLTIEDDQDEDDIDYDEDDMDYKVKEMLKERGEESREWFFDEYGDVFVKDGGRSWHASEQEDTPKDEQMNVLADCSELESGAIRSLRAKKRS